MSEGYASRLSEYHNKGVCGLPEISDSRRQIISKTKELATLLTKAKHVVVITGAGISTQAGIPDFRGPKGVWTQEKESKKKKRKRPTTNSNNNKNSDDESTSPTKKEAQSKLENFCDAKPTICHRAITKLVALGKVNYCITQNVDGLHRRAGLSRDHHASVHGCVFTEKCEACGAEFFHDFDVGGMSFAPTGRNCSLCKGVLRDTLLDWNDGLPEDDFDRAEEEVKKPGTLVLCLGTSLRIVPIGLLPEKADKYAIVNLQQTPMDEQAALIIRAPVDKVMLELMENLGYPKWQEETPPDIERIWTPARYTPHSWPPPKKSDSDSDDSEEE